MTFTDAQIRALIPLRNGACAQFTMRSRTGGAHRRMFERLVAEGICTGPPYYLTAAGAQQLNETVRDMTAQQRAMCGIYSTNGDDKTLDALNICYTVLSELEDGADVEANLRYLIARFSLRLPFQIIGRDPWPRL